MNPILDNLYDEYMDAVTAGKVEPPAEFLARHGVGDAQLLDTLTRVYDECRSRASMSPETVVGNGAAIDRRAPHAGVSETGATGHVLPHDAPTAAGASSTRAGDSRRGSLDDLGDYRLIERLGEGGMGVVFLAEQKALGRRVAVKLLRGEVAFSASAAERFTREAHACARLSHPHIVRIYGVGEHRGTRYIAMEYVEGDGLDRIIERHRSAGTRIPVTQAVRWCAQIARALEHAHEHSIIHRDVKPSNIRIDADGRAMLLDFGVARDLDSAGATLTEAFIGSPFYAAPEQVGRKGGVIDARTDVYSLGLVLYQCVTGVMPIAGGTLEQVLHSILTSEFVAPRRIDRTVPRDLDTVLMKATEKEPARRYRSSGDLAADLEAILELRPVMARPPGRVERAARWIRRNRSATAAVVTAIGVVAIAAGVMWADASAASVARRRAAEALVVEVEELIRAYGRKNSDTAAAESAFTVLNEKRVSGYLTPEEDRRLDDAEADVITARREREAMFYRVLDLTSQAERAGISIDRVERLRASIYLERYLDAERTRPVETSMYRDLVRLHDPAGELEALLRGGTSLSVVTDPPGAEVHAFRREYDSDLREGGERRLVNLPWTRQPASIQPPSLGTRTSNPVAVDDRSRPAPDDAESSYPPPHEWGLRVVKPAGDLRAGDVIMSVAGRPIRGTVLVSRGAGPIPALARLARIDGVEVTDMYGARHFDRVRSSPTGGLEEGLSVEPATPEVPRRFEWIPRAGGSGVIETSGVSVEEFGVEIATPAQLAERGGVEAEVWTDGGRRRVTLPSGLAVRATAAPMYLGVASAVGTSPIRRANIEPGQYVLVVTARGYETQIVTLRVSREQSRDVRISLVRDGTTPEGFVRVTSPERQDDAASRREDFWIMEREVTFREYFEFVNDPQTLAVINASPTRKYYPFNGEEAVGQRASDGTFLIPEQWSPDWPALHVSWEDARAYAQWRTDQARRRGQRVTFDLPTFDQWLTVGGGGATYVFGDRFHPKWVSSCFTRPKPWPESVMSFPIDESAIGAFDMAGSVSEFTRTLWQQDQPHFRYSGGSWGTGDPVQFALWGGNGILKDRHAGFIGFRLVMTVDSDTPPSEEKGP